MGNYTTNPLRAGQENEKATGLDTLGGDAVTAELFGIRRLMSCDSVRRNLKALTTRRMLQGCVARISRHGRRNSITVYTAGKEDAASNFVEIANFLHKVSAASQLRVEQRWQLIIYWAFRKYRLIYRLYPPLLGGQIMLPLALLVPKNLPMQVFRGSGKMRRLFVL